MKNVSKKRSLESAASRHALHGLALPGNVLKALQKRGIYCTPGISVEHQHLARRYMLRGVESGGAVSDMGRACAFVAPDGSPLAWLQRLDSIAVNGRHAILLSDSLVRIEMLRSSNICELAVTLHALSMFPGRAHPEITSKLLFRGRDGVLPLDLWETQHHALRGKLTPIFYDRSGELLPLPRRFEGAIRKITAAVCCVGCKHTHVGVPPVNAGENP